MEDKIRVINIADLPGFPSVRLAPWQVYIGRYNRHVGLNRSPLHNPYKGKASYSSRMWAVGKFEAYFEDSLSQVVFTNPVKEGMAHLRTVVAEHGKIELVCWCKPRPCHGDVIKQALLKTMPVWKGTIDFSRYDENVLRSMVTLLKDVEPTGQRTSRAKVAMTKAQLLDLDLGGYWGQFIWALKEEP